MTKKILLVELDREQGELFSSWLKEEGYEVKLSNALDGVVETASQNTFGLLVMDIGHPGMIEEFLQLCRGLKGNLLTSKIPLIVLAYESNLEGIGKTIEAGIDNFILKPFEADSFLSYLGGIFRRIELESAGNKVLNLNHINALIKHLGKRPREDFFHLAPIIFNKLIMEKIRGILGDPVIMVMINRVRDLTEDKFAFMKKFEFQDGKLVMNDVDTASRGVPADLLAIGFQNFVYAFLSLVRVLTSNILMERK